MSKINEKKLQSTVEDKQVQPQEPVERHSPPIGETNGPKGPDPVRYGDWERKGRCVDF